MPIIQRELRMTVSHHEIGDYIEYGWFRGEIIGLNANTLQQIVRVCEVLRAACGRTVGSTQRVPFNLGREYARPTARNRSIAASTSNESTNRCYDDVQ